LLDNGDTVSINDIQKVFEGATEVQMNKKDKAEKVAVVKRKMAKEGMESVLNGKYYK
jgi:flagellar biosynthesis component FlhA